MKTFIKLEQMMILNIFLNHRFSDMTPKNIDSTNQNFVQGCSYQMKPFLLWSELFPLSLKEIRERLCFENNKTRKYIISTTYQSSDKINCLSPSDR